MLFMRVAPVLQTGFGGIQFVVGLALAAEVGVLGVALYSLLGGMLLSMLLLGGGVVGGHRKKVLPVPLLFQAT